MRWRVAIFGTLGALATVIAAVFVVAPHVPLAFGPVERGVTRLSRTDPKAVMLGATGVVGLYVAWAARSIGGERTRKRASTAERRFDGAVVDPPESVTADRRALTAAGLDADVEVAIERGGSSLRDVRELLRELATETVAERRRQSPAEARTVIDAGEWTEDTVAAAFLGADTGPTASLLSRIRLWLVPERERERRIERTVAALSDLQEAPP